MPAGLEEQMIPSSVGETIRTARKAKGWTQDDLADSAGVSRISVTRLENGSDLSTATLAKVAGALGLTVKVVA